MSRYGYHDNILLLDLSVHRACIEHAERLDSGDMLAENVSARCRCSIAGWVGIMNIAHTRKLYSTNHLEWTVEEGHAEGA